MAKGRGAWAKGGGRPWRRIRDEVLAENQRLNGGLCQVGVTCSFRAPADCVHHVLGRGVTGDDRRYLQAACKKCNEKLGDPQRQADPPVRAVSRW